MIGFKKKQTNSVKNQNNFNQKIIENSLQTYQSFSILRTTIIIYSHITNDYVLKSKYIYKNNKGLKY